MVTTPQTVWYTRCPAPTPLSLAAQQGWLDESFGRHGITVSSIRDNPDPAVRQSHFDHRLDWSFRQGGNIPPIWARASGRDTRLIGADDDRRIPGDHRPAAVRQFARPPSCAGRRLGVPRKPHEAIDFQRATALKGIVSGLSLAGLTATDVELVYLDSAEGKPARNRQCAVSRAQAALPLW